MKLTFSMCDLLGSRMVLPAHLLNIFLNSLVAQQLEAEQKHHEEKREDFDKLSFGEQRALPAHLRFEQLKNAPKGE